MAQMVERVLGKDEVTGSIPVSSSKIPFTKVGGIFTYYFFTIHSYLNSKSSAEL